MPDFFFFFLAASVFARLFFFGRQTFCQTFFFFGRDLCKLEQHGRRLHERPRKLRNSKISRLTTYRLRVRELAPECYTDPRSATSWTFGKDLSELQEHSNALEAKIAVHVHVLWLHACNHTRCIYAAALPALTTIWTIWSS